MIQVMISLRQNTSSYAKQRGDVLLAKPMDAIFTPTESSQGLICEWDDELLEMKLDSVDLIVHPYAVYDEDELQNTSIMTKRSRMMLDVDAMPNAEEILDNTNPVPRMSWVDISPYVKERE